MRRIVDLITGITEASRSATSLSALADAAARAMTGLFPRSSVAVLERDLCEPHAHIIGGANIPASWRTRTVRLTDVPLLNEALRAPERIIGGSVQRGRRVVASQGDRRLQALCAAIPDVGESRYALMLFAPQVAHDDGVQKAALEITRQWLGASAAFGGNDRALMLGAIHRAKLEWEHTADALPEIVGLLDSERRVARVSRAVERWRLGTVRGAIGRNLHFLLHPSCADPQCALGASVEAAIGELNRTSQASFEISDPVLALDLAVVLNGAGSERGRRGPRRQPQRIAFMVANVSTLRSAERELKSLNLTLEQRVAERTAELLTTNRQLRDEVARRREAEKLLRRSTRDLEALSERLMSAQESERKRISQDLHDSVGQTLSAIKYSLERAQLLARRSARLEASGVVEVAIRRVQRLMEEVRTISMNLRPALLDDLGAASAVRGLCRDWQDVYRAVEVEVDISVLDAEIPPLLVTNVFRAVQESLNNVARHAGAQHVCVSMGIVAGVLTLAIRDDGVGFRMDVDSAATAGMRGLRGLRERAERTGGRCEVLSVPGQGTTVQLEWPVAAGQAARMASASLN